jgi:hypothetical protein
MKCNSLKIKESPLPFLPSLKGRGDLNSFPFEIEDTPQA